MKNQKLAVKIASMAFAVTTLLSACSGGASGPAPENITLAEFNQIRPGMTYTEVQNIVGSAGTLMSESGFGEYYSFMVMWYEDDYSGANANVLFQNGIVVSKAQYGLY